MDIIAMTQKGPGKAENEDRIVIGRNLLAQGRMETVLSRGIVAVADGVGGNRGGAEASHFVAQQLTCANAITGQVLTDINRQLLALAAVREGCQAMATTLSGICFGPEGATVFSTGNTRVWVVQGGGYLKQLTCDHTTVQYLLSTGQLTTDQAAGSARKNEITACFGGGSEALLRLQLLPMAMPVTTFLITSDGIHDHLSLDRMEQLLEQHGCTAAACRAMLQAARDSGSQDDASILLGQMRCPAKEE